MAVNKPEALEWLALGFGAGAAGALISALWFFDVGMQEIFTFGGAVVGASLSGGIAIYIALILPKKAESQRNRRLRKSIQDAVRGIVSTFDQQDLGERGGRRRLKIVKVLCVSIDERVKMITDWTLREAARQGQVMIELSELEGRLEGAPHLYSSANTDSHLTEYKNAFIDAINKLSEEVEQSEVA